MCYCKFHRKCFHLSFFFRQFWSFKKPIARMQVASTLRNNNGQRESISLLQMLWKMVRMNHCGNFTTFSITLVSPIEIQFNQCNSPRKQEHACWIIHQFKLHFMPHHERLTKSCLQYVAVIVFFAFV